MPKDFKVRLKSFKFVKDNIRNFYERGFETDNNISIKAGDESLGLLISYGNTHASGVMPSNADTYNRNAFALRGNATHKRFNINVGLNYVKKNMSLPTSHLGSTKTTKTCTIIQTITTLHTQRIHIGYLPTIETTIQTTKYLERRSVHTKFSIG